MKKFKILLNNFFTNKHTWKSLIILCLFIPFTVASYDEHNTWSAKQEELTKLSREQRITERISELLLKEGMDVKYHDAVISSLLKNAHDQEIPIPIMLSVMKYESRFKMGLVSSRGAVGLMQLHPVTWDYYIKKINLDVSKDKIYDPSLNIQVASIFLRDMKNRYENRGYKENVVWDYVLGSYFKGVGSVRFGLKQSHKTYANLVKTKAVEYERYIYNHDDLKTGMAI
jgi:hypothetical protein